MRAVHLGTAGRSRRSHVHRLVRGAGGRLMTFDSDGSRVTISAQQTPYGPWSVPVPIAASLIGATGFDLPASMVDLNPDTAFTGQPAQSGDYVGVDLGIRRPIKTVEFVMSPDGYIHQGVVEYSGDGTGWTPLATVADTPDVTVALPSGVTVQSVRLRATANEAQPVSVREIRTA